MTSIGTGYDLSASTYSPDGRIFQVEYATKAVDNSSTAIGIRCIDGVVLAIEKLVQSKLLVPHINKRIQTVDYHIGIATAGFQADGRHLVGRARDEARHWRTNYKQPINGKSLSDRLAMFMQAYTLYSSVRPFGASVIVGSYDTEGEGSAGLYMLEPSGACFGYKGVAIGKGKQLAKSEIEKLPFATLTCQQALLEVARILHIVHDEAKDRDFELEVSWVGEHTNGRHVLVPVHLIQEAEKQAKALLKPEEMDD